MYTLVWTPAFSRTAKKFIRRHPDLKENFTEVLRSLGHDPFQSHLKYHHLSGKLQGLQAVSITDGYRIILTIIITEKEIILLDVGSHDEVYR